VLIFYTKYAGHIGKDNFDEDAKEMCSKPMS